MGAPSSSRYTLVPIVEPEYDMLVGYNLTVVPTFWKKLTERVRTATDGNARVHFKNGANVGFTRVTDDCVFDLTLDATLSCEVGVTEAEILIDIFAEL